MPVPQFCKSPRRPMRSGVGLCARLIVAIDELKDRGAECPTFAKNKSAKAGTLVFQPRDKLENCDPLIVRCRREKLIRNPVGHPPTLDRAHGALILHWRLLWEYDCRRHRGEMDGPISRNDGGVSP